MTTVLPLVGDDLIQPVAPDAQLVAAALLGIAVIVALITFAKLHPFLALTLGALTVGIVAGVDLTVAITSFTTGFGTTAAGVGTLIALGAMFGKLLADSGGADQIVDTIVGKASPEGAALGDGRRRRDHRAADVLRDRPRAADAGDLPGRPPLAAAP